jgi:hypothetical protein
METCVHNRRYAVSIAPSPLAGVQRVALRVGGCIPALFYALFEDERGWVGNLLSKSNNRQLPI